MIGWCPELKCAVACRLGELSQQPTWPHDMHIRRCTHWPPMRRQSSQPSLLGRTSAIWSRWLQDWLIACSFSCEVTRRQLVGGNDPESPGLVVLEGLDDLRAGVHHEGTVVSDRRTDWQTAEDQDIKGLGLPVGGRHDDVVAGAEHHELADLDRAPLGSGGAGEDVGQRAEGGIPGD